MFLTAVGGSALAVNDVIAGSGNSATVYFQQTADYSGPDSFTYRASNGSLSSSTATVSITVMSVNDPPVANWDWDSFTTIENGASEFGAPGLLANDTDVDGDALTASLYAAASHGTVVAHSDGVSYGKGSGDWEEWDAERLSSVLPHVDAAIAELYESSFRPLSALQCAQLLHGELGFWVAQYIDQLDPPPAYGLFAHVQLAALLARVEAPPDT